METTSYWINPTIYFGTIKRNNNRDFVFQAIPTIPRIVNVQAACGCTSVKYIEDTKQLKVTFKAGEIPKQIIGDAQAVDKKITITYADNTTEVLSLIGTKIR